MKTRENEKTSNIVSTLCLFFLQKGSCDVHFDLEPAGDCCMIHVEGTIDLTEAELAQMEEHLLRPQAPEVSYYYDELLGSGGDIHDISLLGYVTELSGISYEDGVLKLSLRRICSES